MHFARGQQNVPGHGSPSHLEALIGAFRIRNIYLGNIIGLYNMWREKNSGIWDI